MKKTSLLLCIALLFSCLAFTSCTQNEADEKNEPVKKIETAEELMERIDETMDQLDLYEIEMDMDITFYIQYKQLKNIAEGRLIISGTKSQNYVYYNETKVNISSDELDVNKETESVLAFRDGEIFMSNQLDEIDQKIRSKISKEDFIIFLAEQNDSQFDVLDCENKAILQNEDESWKLTCSGYSPENAIKLLGESFDTDTLGAPITDMELTMNADKDFHMADMSIRFIFEKTTSNMPEVNVSFECVSFNDSKVEDGLIDKTKYTEVPDVRDYYKIERLIKEAVNKSRGYFNLDINQAVTIDPEEKTSSERYIVYYGINDEKYYHQIISRSDNGTFEINYKEGVQTVTGAKDTEMTDMEAKTLMQTLINSANYDKTRVSTLEKTDNGYVVTIKDLDISAFGLSNYKIDSQTQILIITYTLTEDGELKTIESQLEIKGMIELGYNAKRALTITKTTNLEFDPE